MTHFNKNNKKILILDSGEAPYPLTIARSLGSAGYYVILGFSYGSHIFPSYSRYCKGYLFYPDPSYALDDFLTFFKSLRGKYNYIIPTLEKTQIAMSMIKDFMENAGTTIPIPDYEVLSMVINKTDLLELVDKNKIAFPQSIVLTEESEFDKVVKEINIPFIMKTSTEINIPPGPGKRYFVIKNRISQKDFLTKFRKLRVYGPVILQRYVRGTGIGASFIFSRTHKLIAFFGHKRILERFLEGGPSVIAETYFHPEAIEQGMRLLRSLNWQGVAMVEFKLGCDNKLYFMELNPRFWGTLPLAIASGLDFPRLLVDYYNSSHQKIRPLFIKKKMFVTSFTIPYLLINSIKEKNLDFMNNIFQLLLKIFKYGFPFLTEFEKIDLCPQIMQFIYSFKGYLNKGNISKIDTILFGPEIVYKKLLKFNVRSIIDLREELEKNSVRIPSAIDYYSFPIQDDSAPEITFFLRLVNMIEKLHKKGPIYIHCRLGRGRAPMVVIAYLTSKRLPIENAYSTVYNVRPYSHLNSIQKKAIYMIYKKSQPINKER